MFIGSTFVLKLNDTGEEMAEALPEEETGREDGSDGELKNVFLASFVSFDRLETCRKVWKRRRLQGCFDGRHWGRGRKGEHERARTCPSHNRY